MAEDLLCGNHRNGGSILIAKAVCAPRSGALSSVAVLLTCSSPYCTTDNFTRTPENPLPIDTSQRNIVLVLVGCGQYPKAVGTGINLIKQKTYTYVITVPKQPPPTNSYAGS